MQGNVEAGRMGFEAFGASVRRGVGGPGGLREDTPAPRADAAPASAEEFAERVMLAICGTGVSPAVGRRAYERCRRALEMGATVRIGFRHPGKADAIDRVWRDRDRLYGDYLVAADKLAVLDQLPWVGPVTKRALARGLGLPNGRTDQEIASFRAAA